MNVHRLGSALLLAATATTVGAQPAKPPPADVRAIQESEARKADERMLAHFARFRAALVARFGADPQLIMLAVSEAEGSALVVTVPGTSELVLWQQGSWIDTAHRQLKPWARPEVAAAHPFRLSLVRESAIRAALQEWRRAPGHATDFLGDLAVGYDPRGQQVLVRHTAGSLATGKLELFTYDPQTGRRLVVLPPVKKSDDLRADVEQALVALRDAAPQARLGTVRVTRREIVFVLVDRSTLRFDEAFELAPGDRDEFAAVCADGFAANDVDWPRLPELPRDAVARTRLDAEDAAHATFTIDRGRGCGPLTIEVAFGNYKAPEPRVRFDARGAYLGKSW